MISAPELLRFRALLEQRMGFLFEDGKLEQLREVFERVWPQFADSPARFLEMLQAPEKEPLRSIARELTVTETFFFRGADQLRAFREAVLPARAVERRYDRKISVLSAGCSSGEEAYSLAIGARHHPALEGYTIDVRAIDLNVAALERARRGRYSVWSLRETTPELRARWFEEEKSEIRLIPALRDAVVFSEHNLLDEDPVLLPRATFDVIFCRNVLMYFSRPNAVNVVARLARALLPGGFLFLGHAETMRGLSEAFHLHHTHGAFYYQKKETDEAPVAFSYTPIPIPYSGWSEPLRLAEDQIRSISVQRDALMQTLPRPVPDVVHTFDLSQALELLAEERFAETGKLLARQPASSDKDPNVLLLRAVLATHGGELSTAQRLGERVLAIDEMNAGAHYVIALCREQAGDRAAAIDHHKLAAYIDPEFAMPRLHLGMLARRSGKADDARRELQKALALLEDDDVSRIVLYGGGFNREALVRLCRAELLMVGGGR
jgi:chemotaxis protein methyltransferase CheR